MIQGVVVLEPLLFYSICWLVGIVAIIYNILVNGASYNFFLLCIMALTWQ